MSCSGPLNDDTRPCECKNRVFGYNRNVDVYQSSRDLYCENRDIVTRVTFGNGGNGNFFLFFFFDDTPNSLKFYDQLP